MSNRIVIGTLLLIFLFTTLAVSYCSAAPNIQVFLNNPTQNNKPKDSCTSSTCKPLLRSIRDTKISIDFAIYGMRNQTEILNALVDAQQRGVKIRGIVDADIHGENYYPTTKELIAVLGSVKSDFQTDLNTKKKVANKTQYSPYCDRPVGFNGPLQCVGYSLSRNSCLISAMASRKPIEFKGDIMHNKFFVFDNQKVWTGSTNISDSGTGGYNANIALLIDDPVLAGFYSSEFEQMYVDGKHHREKNLFHKKTLSTTINNTLVDISFSPQGYTVEKLLRPLIKQSSHYIDVPVFFLTHKKLAGDLIQAHQRGVKVRIIIDATAAKNGYSKHELLRAAGIPVKVENWGGKMHMKVAVIDGKHLVAGSMNWTTAGERNNDENTVVIHDTLLAGKVHSFFNDIWQSIPDRWLSERPDPESRNSSTACYDGVDNDFDGLADKDDPGCSLSPPPMPELPPYRIVNKGEGSDLVKGNISYKNKNKIYILPKSKYYLKTKINLSYGEKWFCSIYDARESGWKSYKEY